MTVERRQPRIFVGSSTEGLPVAFAIQENLDFEAEVTVWSQGVFLPSNVVLSRLIASLKDYDFAIFVFTPDDSLTMRGGQYSSVRDNVIFELGLFLGRLGGDRCFFVAPRHAEALHLPTDLLGIVPLSYNEKRQDGRLVAALGAACNQIRAALRAAEIADGKEAENSVLPSRFWEKTSVEDYVRLWNESDMAAARSRIRLLDHDPRSEEFQGASNEIMKIYAFLESLADGIVTGALEEQAAKSTFEAAILSFWPFYATSRGPVGWVDPDDYWQEIPQLAKLYEKWKVAS
ncbi:TIR domain-containing protein [Pararhizobium polonicum]|uniref:TIR domain-containing protein n=1 Tax=Pararhizobium polonicum TaxID=1612624 RepID=UPI00083B1F26|nr:TIR domain-containing protein [Pararhizobium polonicum]